MGVPCRPRCYPGRRRGRALGRRAPARALAAWASAAGFGLVAWGLGTEAPTPAEAQQYIEQQKDLMRERGIEVPATAAGRNIHGPPRLSNALYVLALVGMVFGVRYGLPAADGARDRRRSLDRRVLWPAGAPGRAAAQAEDAVGSALVVAGSVARLRAASAEPLR